MISTFPAVAYVRGVAAGAKQVRTLNLSRLRKVFSLMGRGEKIAFVLLAAVALTSGTVSARGYYVGHTTPAPASGGTYTEAIVGYPAGLNPILDVQEPDTSIERLIYSGLYHYGATGKLEPDIAEAAPEISEDQKRYTVRIRQGATWHDGKPVTAQDVVFTVEAVQNPAYKSPLRTAWLSTTVAATDDRTVTFTTKDVSGPFVHNLALPLLPRHLWGNVPPDQLAQNPLASAPVGSGPYQVVEARRHVNGRLQTLKLAAVSGAAPGQANIETVVLKFYATTQDALNALHSKEVDGFGYVPDGTGEGLDPNRAGAQVLELPIPQFQYAFFNLKNAAFADLSVRQALQLASDPAAIAAATGAAPSSNASAPNMVQAGKLLDAAGWVADEKTGIRTKKGKELSLVLSTNAVPANQTAAGLLAKQWRQLGVKASAEALSTKDLTDSRIRPRQFDVIVLQVRLGADPDPFPFWHSTQAKDPGLNISGWSSREADAIIATARATTDQSARGELYARLNATIARELPAIPLTAERFRYALPKDMKGIRLTYLPDPAARFYDLPNWHLAEQRLWK